jgi:hypothetical protein
VRLQAAPNVARAKCAILRAFSPLQRIPYNIYSVFGVSWFISRPERSLLPEIEAMEDDASLRSRFIFSSTDYFKVRWDVIVMLCVIICSVEIPFVIGFNVPVADYSDLFYLDSLINWIFIADMFISFRSAFFIDEKVVTTPWRVARAYLCASAIICFLTSVSPASFDKPFPDIFLTLTHTT